MTNPLDKYLSALERFNQAVAELTAKYEQANQAREEALQASADLRRELEDTDQRVHEISLAFHQQMSADLSAKRVPQPVQMSSVQVARAS
jgi:DNA repair exonuclease SbcCD ATPase subunit